MRLPDKFVKNDCLKQSENGYGSIWSKGDIDSNAVKMALETDSLNAKNRQIA